MTPTHRPATRRALIVVDVQDGFGDATWWGRRDDAPAEANIAALLTAWREHDQPVVVVRHDSTTPGSPLAAGQPGNALASWVDVPSQLLVVKSVNSAFYGEPDLHGWLQAEGIGALAVCGITTNHCCETTTRMAGNLGYDVQFVLDATVAFDVADLDGHTIPAEEVKRVSAANLHGEFAEVISTADAVRSLASRPAGG